MNLIALDEPNQQWDKFVSSHSPLIFHTSLWWKVIKQGYKCETKYLVAEDNGRWIATMPGMIVGNRLFRVFYSLIPYGGFIGDRQPINEFMGLVNDWVKREKIQRIQIVDLNIKKKEEMPDFKCVESYRHLLELKDKTTDQIWKRYQDGLKRNIKTALKSNLSVEKIKSLGEVSQFYQLYLDSMKRNQALAKYPLELFHEIYELMVPEFADILFTKYQDKAVAGMVVIYSPDMAHYFHGGSATAYLHFRPNDLLFHSAIQMAKEKGKSYFDFLGSDKKLTSLIQFKDKWGTQKEELFNIHRDFGLVRPFLFKTALKLAQTTFGSTIHRRLKAKKGAL